MSIEAVLFDLDDTLVVDEAVSKMALRATAEAAGRFGVEAELLQRAVIKYAAQLWKAGPCHAECRRLGISAFECMWGKFVTAGEKWCQLREWALKFRVDVFDCALREQMVENSGAANELARCFEDKRRQFQRLMPDALEVMLRLKGNYKLGLVTNGAPDLQREKLSASGLEPLFDAVAISGEHDIGKPQAELFHRILDELGVQSSHAAMVGNSMERDIAGANAAGITSIWIKVLGSEELADCHPNYTITGLAELPNLLQGSGSVSPTVGVVSTQT